MSATAEIVRETFFDNDTAEFQELPDTTILYSKCGHRASRLFHFVLWGRDQNVTIKKRYIRKRKGSDEGVVHDCDCPACYFKHLKATSIRCARCGSAIIDGDTVALYPPSAKGLNKEAATLVDDHMSVVCMSMKCASGGFFAGYWTANGFEPKD